VAGRGNPLREDGSLLHGRALPRRQLGLAHTLTEPSWRQEYGGLKSDQVRRMKELEIENQRLRKAVAELTLDKLILKRLPRETGKPRTPARLC